MLEPGGLFGIDPDVRERAEAGGDAVHDLARRDRVLDHGPRRDDPLTRAPRERHVVPRRDGRDVRQRERSPTATVTARRLLPDPGRPHGSGRNRSSKRTSGPVSCIT